MKILLLEDDFALHKAIKNILLEAEYEVKSFYDGLLAYENVGVFFELYLLDINVPNVDGLEITKKIKSLNPNAKVIILSANGDIATIKKGYLNGCDDYLKKPFDIEELLIKVRKIIPKEETNIVYFDDRLQYDLKKKTLLYANEQIELTKKELLFFNLLVSNINQTLLYEQLIETIYKNEISDINALRSLVKRLRKKLPLDIIQTDTIGGYAIYSLTRESHLK